MKVIITCGGKGTRLREETAVKPKPIVPLHIHDLLDSDPHQGASVPFVTFHIKLFGPMRGFIVISKTPSDRRALYNIRQLVKRASSTEMWR